MSPMRRPRPPAIRKKPPAESSQPLVDLSSGRRQDVGISKNVASRHLHVLIVDDEPMARRLLREELEQQPEVEVLNEADNGARALVEIESLKPDVVLLDLQMPRMGGFEVIRELRGGPHVPVVIVVTAYDQYAIRAFEEGAIDYLLKPVAQARLVKALDRARELLGRRLGPVETLTRLQEVAGGAPGAAGAPRKIVGRSGGE